MKVLFSIGVVIASLAMIVGASMMFSAWVDPYMDFDNADRLVEHAIIGGLVGSAALSIGYWFYDQIYRVR